MKMNKIDKSIFHINFSISNSTIIITFYTNNINKNFYIVTKINMHIFFKNSLNCKYLFYFIVFF